MMMIMMMMRGRWFRGCGVHLLRYGCALHGHAVQGAARLRVICYFQYIGSCMMAYSRGPYIRKPR
eukprot:764706-Karenia_brevis.AAC.1